MGSKGAVRHVRRLEKSRDVRGVIAVLTQSRHRDDVDVQAACLRVLGNVCFHDAWNGRLAGRSGAIEALVDAMRRHGGNEKVQEDGCFALRSMCRYGDENGRLAGRCGAIEAVVHAMKRHGGSEDVQYSGCWALNNMCYGNAENARLAGRYLSLIHI